MAPLWGIGLSGAAERATGGAAAPLGARWSPASTAASASGEPMAANGNRPAVRASALAGARAVLRGPARRRGRAVSRRSLAGRKDGPHRGGSAFLGPQNGRRAERPRRSARDGRPRQPGLPPTVSRWPPTATRPSANGERVAANGEREEEPDGSAYSRGCTGPGRRVSRATGGRPGVGVAAVSKRGALRGARETGPGETRARDA